MAAAQIEEGADYHSAIAAFSHAANEEEKLRLAAHIIHLFHQINRFDRLVEDILPLAAVITFSEDSPATTQLKVLLRQFLHHNQNAEGLVHQLSPLSLAPSGLSQPHSLEKLASVLLVLKMVWQPLRFHQAAEDRAKLTAAYQQPIMNLLVALVSTPPTGPVVLVQASTIAILDTMTHRSKLWNVALLQAAISIFLQILSQPKPADLSPHQTKAWWNARKHILYCLTRANRGDEVLKNLWLAGSAAVLNVALPLLQAFKSSATDADGLFEATTSYLHEFASALPKSAVSTIEPLWRMTWQYHGFEPAAVALIDSGEHFKALKEINRDELTQPSLLVQEISEAMGRFGQNDRFFQELWIQFSQPNTTRTQKDAIMGVMQCLARKSKKNWPQLVSLVLNPVLFQSKDTLLLARACLSLEKLFETFGQGSANHLEIMKKLWELLSAPIEGQACLLQTVALQAFGSGTIHLDLTTIDRSFFPLTPQVFTNFDTMLQALDNDQLVRSICTVLTDFSEVGWPMLPLVMQMAEYAGKSYAKLVIEENNEELALDYMLVVTEALSGLSRTLSLANREMAALYVPVVLSRVVRRIVDAHRAPDATLNFDASSSVVTLLNAALRAAPSLTPELVELLPVLLRSTFDADPQEFSTLLLRYLKLDRELFVANNASFALQSIKLACRLIADSGTEAALLLLIEAVFIIVPEVFNSPGIATDLAEVLSVLALDELQWQAMSLRLLFTILYLKPQFLPLVDQKQSKWLSTWRTRFNTLKANGDKKDQLGKGGLFKVASLAVASVAAMPSSQLLSSLHGSATFLINHMVELAVLSEENELKEATKKADRARDAHNTEDNDRRVDDDLVLEEITTQSDEEDEADDEFGESDDIGTDDDEEDDYHGVDDDALNEMTRRELLGFLDRAHGEDDDDEEDGDEAMDGFSDQNEQEQIVVMATHLRDLDLATELHKILTKNKVQYDYLIGLLDNNNYKALFEIFSRAKTGPPALRILALRKLLFDTSIDLTQLTGDLLDAMEEYISKNYTSSEAKRQVEHLHLRLKPPRPQ